MPIEANRLEIRRAAGMSFEQVKQWAKMAVATWGPSGMSRRAARSWPEWPVNISFSVGTDQVLFKSSLRCHAGRPGESHCMPMSRDRDRRAFHPPQAAIEKTFMTSIVISLTSIPPRYRALPRVLECLCNQRGVQVDEIRLNIPRRYRRDDFAGAALPELPKGVRLVRCEEDFGPATKLLPTLLDLGDSDTAVMFCDDDQHYDNGWAARMFKAGRRMPETCIAQFGQDLGTFCHGEAFAHVGRQPRARITRTWRHRAWRISTGFRHKRWFVGRSGYADILFGFRGAMVRPGFFPPEVFDIPDDLAMVDDPWLSGHLARAGVPIWVIANTPQMRGWRETGSNPLTDLEVDGFGRAEADRACVRYFQDRYGIWGGGELNAGGHLCRG